jgi:beta-glucanase (GH16 family)
MRKAALILVFLAALALFSWYIYDPGDNDRWIGHQSENIQALQLPAESVMESTSVMPTETATAVASKAVPAASPKATPPEGWTPEWSDEFDTLHLNLEYWTEIDRRDSFNGELQYYTPDNSRIENGHLILTARQEQLDDREYTSGMIHTYSKLEMLYGRIEARISLPVAQGIFPAFWLTTDSDLHEIDVLEMIGCEPGNIYGVCHFKKNKRASKVFGMLQISDPELFHIYSVEWEKDEVRWYVDDVQFFSTQTGVPDEPLYVVLTLAVGGEWPGDPDDTTKFPLSMAVDYVRIYSRDMEGDPHDIS